jgi:Fic family protein
LLDLFFEKPIINIPLVEEYLQCSYETANKTVKQLETLDLLNEITGWQRNRLYRYDPYLALFANSYPQN